MTTLVIVTGPPAAGKTLLARRLAADLRLPLMTKDDIKESLFESLGWDDRAWSHRLGIASYDLLHVFAAPLLAAGITCMLEANFHVSFAGDAFRRLMNHAPFSPVQIVCRADPETLTRRFRDRDLHVGRHPGHVDHSLDIDFYALAANGNHGALDIGGTIIDVDTTDFSTMDYVEITRRLRDVIATYTISDNAVSSH